MTWMFELYYPLPVDKERVSRWRQVLLVVAQETNGGGHGLSITENGIRRIA